MTLTQTLDTVKSEIGTATAALETVEEYMVWDMEYADTIYGALQELSTALATIRRTL